MHNGRTIKIAGPTDDPQVGAWVTKTKTLMALRDRIHVAASNARPPHARRPTKGGGRWPSRIRFTDLRL